MYDFEVIVSGAGPAGASASLFLSQQGIPHLVFDRSIFPRHKVCGDGLTPMCFTLLEQVIPDIKARFATHQNMQKVAGVRLFSNKGRYADFFSKDYVKEEKDHVYTGSRYHFDHLLVEELQLRKEATLWQDTQLMDYTVEADGVVVTLKHDGALRKLKTKLLIAADGDRSLARKRMHGAAIKRDRTVAAVRAYYSGVKPLGNHDLYEIYALKEVLPGYLWIFPMTNGGHNVGLGTTSNLLKDKKMNMRQLLATVVHEHPLLKERFKDAVVTRETEGSGLPLMMETEPLLSMDRVLLTGDAAAIADPISGEGIGPAIVSGKYAAYAAKQAIEARDFSQAFFAVAYDQMIHQKITKHYELRIKLFDWFIKHPWKIEAFLWGATRLRLARNFIANAMNNKYRIKEIKNPLNWKRVFGKPVKYG